jgi:hypothetical protein
MVGKATPKIDYLIEKLATIFRMGCESDGTFANRRTIIGAGDLAFLLCDETLDAYEDVVRTLLKNEDWSLRFSEKFIEEGLNKILLKMTEEKTLSNLRSHVSSFIEDVQVYAKEHVVYVPLTGIQVEANPVQIGNVTIREITDEELVSILESWERHFPNIAGGAIERQNNVRESQRSIVKVLRRITCTEFRVIAEPTRALERALEETRRILDLLRYSIPALYPSNSDVKVAIKGELFQGSVMQLVLATDSTALSKSQVRMGPLQPLRLTQENLDHMHSIGVFRLGGILQKQYNSVSDFEKALLTGLHWYANAQTRTDPADRLRDLVTCLEAYLTPKDGNPIGTAVAEGVAIIVTRSLEDRKRIKKKIKDLYSLRSAVSHGGRTSVLQQDVNDLEQIAGQVTMLLVDRLDEFTSKKDLLEWIENQKLA